MKHNVFTFKNNKLLCWRLGPMSSQKQLHYGKDVVTIAGQGDHKPPESRGIWAFPYPHYDYFFCFHQWEKHLPKKYLEERTLTEFEAIERDQLLKEIQKKYKPSLFYADGFYSHIFPYKVDYNSWFYWDSVRDWANVAKKEIVCYIDFGGGFFANDYSKDHLEIFVPNFK